MGAENRLAALKATVEKEAEDGLARESVNHLKKRKRMDIVGDTEERCVCMTLLNPEEMPKAEPSQAVLEGGTPPGYCVARTVSQPGPVSPKGLSTWLHTHIYLSLLGYNLGIRTFHGAGLMEMVCPFLHLPEGSGTEDARTRTQLGGFCLKPAGQAGYMGQQKVEAEPLQKVKQRIRKEP
ncbi:hypothetical protein llap_11449 [Limosa lapponica baueri]|uniref:Uncharacterized protein n=1 Tax=Limosa lapponica baueri TaxID=1758121 RepID=A0A2I0TWR2_LIMLA|nr:hypothetical protein llap_11449 [Limosa lapponica baueri]